MNTTAGKEIHHELLDAAEEVVTRDGVARLTLEAVARQAGLSKSGLLHHFPNKEALIDAVVERTVLKWSQSLEEAVKNQPKGPQQTARALLHCCLGDMSLWNERMLRSSTALLAVLVHCADRSTPMHHFYQQVHARMAHESKGNATGDLVLAVIDGIWLRWVTGLAPLEESQIIHIRETLKLLLSPANKPKRKSGSN